MEIEGVIPGGAMDSVKIKVASIVPFLIVKAMALDNRLKEKDSWDIYYCLKHHPGGLDALVDEFAPLMENSMVIEGLNKLAKHFHSEKYIGPKFAADFEEIIEKEEREIVERDAYERVAYLLQNLGVK